MQCALFIFSRFLNVIYLIFKLALDLIITATLKYQFYHPYPFLAQTAFPMLFYSYFGSGFDSCHFQISSIFIILRIHILSSLFCFIFYSFPKQASFLYFILPFPRLFKLYIIGLMNPNNNQLKANINASVFKASYIGGFKNPESIKKSQIQKNSMLQGDVEQIDDKTFKIMPNFVKPTENIVIYKQTGKCFIEQQSFFSCFSARRAYDFQLNNSKFYVKNSQKIMRFVDFNVIWAFIQEKGNGFVIAFQGSQSQMYVEVTGNNKAQQSEKLLKNLRNLIQQTDGKEHKLNYLASKSPLDFFKTQHVLCSEFQKCANSGDVVLFKSQHSAASVQRVFTDSEYDHVGVVLRNRKNEIFIYESTSDSGVGLTKWNQFVKYEWYTLIDKVCWRPLSINLTSSDIQTIERFVIKTLGKQFELNLDKLLTFKSALTRTTEEEEKKTYFCSELVARLYKELGILNEQKSSTSYFPVDFSDRGSLKIVREGVKLNNQRLISFDKI